MVTVSTLLAVGTLLLWLLVALLALALLILLLLLLLPLDLYLHLDSDLAEDGWDGDWTGAARWLLRTRWGWGLLRAQVAGENLTLTEHQFRIMGKRIEATAGKQKKQPKLKEAKRTESKRQRPAKKKRQKLDWELVRAGLTEGLQFLGRLRQALGLRWEGRLTYGFSDPAVTGWTEAILWATGRPLPVDASFQQACLTGRAQVKGRIYGAQVVWAALRSLRNPVIRNRLFNKFRFNPLRYRTVRGG